MNRKSIFAKLRMFKNWIIEITKFSIVDAINTLIDFFVSYKHKIFCNNKQYKECKDENKIESKFTKLFNYIISLLTFLFLIFILYNVLFSNLIDPILPERFSKTVSKVLLMLAVLLCAALILIANRLLNFYEKLNDFQIISLLFSFAILLPLPLIIFSEVEPKSDYYTYYKMAEMLSKGGVFIPNYVAVFPHTIGFPAVLSVVFHIFGPSVFLAQLIGVLFSAFSVVFVYLIGSRTIGKQYGFLSAMLWLIMPSRVLYTLLICTENLFNAFALFTVLLFLHSVKEIEFKKYLLLFGLVGVQFSLLSAIRPNGVILFIVCLVFYIVYGQSRNLRTARLKMVGCFVAIVAYLLTSILINIAIEKKIDRKIASTKVGWNLYVGLNAKSLGRWNKKDSDLFGKLLLQKGPEGAQRTFLRLGYDRLKDHIKQKTLLKFIIDKMRFMWFADHEAYEYISGSQKANSHKYIKFSKDNKRIKLLCDGYYYLLLILALIAFGVQTKKKDIKSIMILGSLIILGTVALHIPFEAAMRYKNHTTVWLCFLAAQGVSLMRK